jgi:hypothetical protein
MRYYGGQPVDMGNAGALMAGSPSFNIGPRSPFKGMSQEELNKLKEWDQRPGELQQYYEKINSPGPKLPFAYQGGTSFPIAQAYPGGQAIGNAAGMLGGEMGMNPALMQQMQEQMAGAGRPPVNFGVDIENEKVKALRGNVSAQLDPNQRVNFGGEYNVIDQTGRLGLGYQTPTFGFDVNVTRTSPMMGAPGGYGGMMNMGGRF